MNFFLERLGYFLTIKNDSESQNLAIFDNFHSADLKFFLLILGLKEGLVECATVCVKSEVILTYVIALKQTEFFHRQGTTPLKRTIFNQDRINQVRNLCFLESMQGLDCCNLVELGPFVATGHYTTQAHCVLLGQNFSVDFPR